MRNVILLCLDTVRKDYFDEYAPRLVERSEVVYVQARAASAWSIPSHASMFAGTLPHQHGVHTHARDYTPLADRGTFLADLPGHAAVGVSANAYVGSAFGFDSLFDTFHDVSRDSVTFTNGLDPLSFQPSTEGRAKVLEYLRESLRNRYPVRSLANAVLSEVDFYEPFFSGRPWPELLDNGTRAALSLALDEFVGHERDDRPVFGFVNLMEAHTPMYHHYDYDRSLHSVPNRWTSKEGPEGGAYDLSHHAEEFADYLENWRQLYGASIDYLDRHVSDWLDDLRARTTNPTSVIITSDHGQNLGLPEDDGMFGHHTSLTESVLHVPMTVVNPPAGYDPEYAEYASHLDLGRLVSAIADDRVLDVTRDVVLAEVMGHTGAFPIDTDLTYWDRQLRCFYDAAEPDRKVVWDSLETTTTVEIDGDQPCWQRNLEETELPPEADTRAFESDILTSKRGAVIAELLGPDRDIDDATVERLADLGYL